MHWYYLATVAMIGTTLFSLFIKLNGDKISPLLGTLVMQLAGLITLLSILFIHILINKPVLFYTMHGLIYSILAGISIAITNLCIFYIFYSHAPLSIATPLMRIGGMLMVVLLGLYIFNEKLNLEKSIGIFLSIIAIYLLTKP